MADDATLTARTSGESATIAARLIELASGKFVAPVRIDKGTGTAESLVTDSNPFPVTGPVTDAQLRASAVPVSAAALPLPSGAATQATLAEVDTTLDAILASMSGSAAVDSGSSVTVGATTTQILAADATRKGLILYFEGDTYVAFGASATSAAMLFLAGSYLNMLTGFVWRGAINGLRVGGSDVTVRKVAF
jgi:hypothetical protein